MNHDEGIDVPAKELTIQDLTRILREAAGEIEGINLDGDILDRPFEELGYDSLALLEAGGRIERENDVDLEGSSITIADTPRALLADINRQLAASHAA